MIKKSLFGFSVVEVILSVATIAIVSATLLPTIGWLATKSSQSKSSQQASLLMQEGAEVAYNVILGDWTLSPGVYHPAVEVNGLGREAWVLAPGVDGLLEAKYHRRIEVSAVCRDASTGQEGTPGCVTDANSKRVITTVTWAEAGVQKRVEAQLLVANFSEQ